MANYIWRKKIERIRKQNKVTYKEKNLNNVEIL